MWLSCSTFLVGPPEEWPKDPTNGGSILSYDPEIKRSALVNMVEVKEKSDSVSHLINYFSTWIRLKKAVACIFRLKKKSWLMRGKETTAGISCLFWCRSISTLEHLHLHIHFFFIFSKYLVKKRRNYVQWFIECVYCLYLIALVIITVLVCNNQGLECKCWKYLSFYFLLWFCISGCLVTWVVQVYERLSGTKHTLHLRRPVKHVHAPRLKHLCNFQCDRKSFHCTRKFPWSV